MAYDYIMRMPGKFKDHIMPDKIHILNVSFIMKSFQREYGGTGGNIAYSLSLLEVPTLLVAAVGNDSKEYLEHLGKYKNLDLSGVKKYKEKTARGFVTTDSDDNQIWGFYEGAMKFADEVNLIDHFQDGDFLVVAPNDPKAMMKYVKQAQQQGIPYMFDPAFNIPHFRVRDLINAVEHAKVLIGNDYEIQLIEKRLHERSAKNILNDMDILITTLGPKGVRIVDKNSVMKIPPAKPENTSDPTGAGDAFRAGFLAGLYYSNELLDAGRMGAVNAVYTVEKYGTQTHDFDKKEFLKRFSSNYESQISL